MWQMQWQQLPAFVTQINWPNWLAIVGTSSAVSSIVVLFMQAARDKVIRRRERRDAALDVALSLEAYGRSCRAMIHRAEWARAEIERSGQREALKSAMLPPFRYPERIQWRCFKQRVVSDLRDFPARIHVGQEELGAFAEFGEPLAFCDEVSLASARVARDALALARETRKKNGCVPWRPGAEDADLNRELIALIARAEKRQEALREARQEAHSSRSSATIPLEAISSVATASSPRVLHP